MQLSCGLGLLMQLDCSRRAPHGPLVLSPVLSVPAMKLHPSLLRFALGLSFLGSFSVLGCAQGTGDLAVRVKPEITIKNGVVAGQRSENMRDGWTATFDKYVVVLGPVFVSQLSDASRTEEAHETFVLDLKKVPESGAELWKLPGLDEGRWNVGFELSTGAHDAERHSTVTKEDFERIVDEDLTYLIEGSISKEGGLSCPPKALVEAPDRKPAGQSMGGSDCYEAETVAFSFAVRAPTVFDACELDGIPGVAIGSGGVRTTSITLHGDHMFFNGFPVGDEGSVRRLAQWIADSDLNLDGVVSEAELKRIPLGALAAIDPDVYQLGGSPIELETAYDFLRGALKTQGHMESEGECRVDGVAHDHDHDHDHGDEEDHGAAGARGK